jgi:hypothetical protein
MASIGLRTPFEIDLIEQGAGGRAMVAAGSAEQH